MKLMKHRRKWTPAFIALQNGTHTLQYVFVFTTPSIYVSEKKLQKETEIYYQRNSGCLLLQCDSLSLWLLLLFDYFAWLLLFACIVLFYICVRVLSHVKAKDRLTDFRRSESDMAFQL